MLGLRPVTLEKMHVLRRVAAGDLGEKVARPAKGVFGDVLDSLGSPLFEEVCFATPNQIGSGR